MEVNIVKGLSSSAGLVPGPYRQEPMVCQYTHMVNSQGSVWLGGDPFSYTTPVLLAQFALIFIVTRSVFFFIKPLKQSLMSAQIIAGVIMGPSLLARNRAFAAKVLPPGGRLILNTFADLGFMLHLFLLGVQIDLNMFKKARKSAVLIGTTGFFMAMVLGGLAMATLHPMAKLDERTVKSLPIIVTINSITSFAVITTLLADLNMLNSEMGRLATFTSLVADLWSYSISAVLARVGAAVRISQWGLMWSLFWIAFYVLVIVFLLRPLILLIVQRLPQGKLMKETHFVHVIVIVLGCGFLSEVLGQHSGFGSFMLGMVVPDGPLLGDTLIYRLEVMSTGLFLPAKFVITGLNVDLSSIKMSSAAVIELIIIFGYIGKFLGTLVTACYCSLPFWDAVTLALVMCCKGIIDVAAYNMLKDEGILDNQEYALLIITMLIVTGVIRTLVAHLYDPSRRYTVQNRSTIQDSRGHNLNLRILVCIHNEDSVPAIINLLEASNPTHHSPISVLVLTLVELKRMAAAILVPNFRKGKLTYTFSHSRHILNAFSYYAQENQGRIFLQHLTAVAPYSSMHDDVCTLALDQGVTIVIVPFHKQWTIDGTVGAISSSIWTVNQNVMNKAPCSVGVLVDRSQMTGSWSGFLSGQYMFRIALLFLSGADDDREALMYGRRMADHPNVTLTVAWIRPVAHNKRRMVLREEMVEDAEGTTQVIHSMEDSFDLFIVGRHHEPDSPLTIGLTEWSECPELGVIGDMLASSDFSVFSSGGVQQQPRGIGFLDTNLMGPINSRRDVDSEVYQGPSYIENYHLHR
ncbi:cation/hydrogen exchanger 14 [Actinidia rufa]|uniref:Cation/hydrogen exchanger 14 n=1 Tax=Actinidia rufa TaxID=165716 RepID=A0A7J0FT16_9ERIC|nr:cation/hydrogen exchanger 14 [Actinidia rufa]